MVLGNNYEFRIVLVVIKTSLTQKSLMAYTVEDDNGEDGLQYLTTHLFLPVIVVVAFLQVCYHLHMTRYLLSLF